MMLGKPTPATTEDGWRDSKSVSHSGNAINRPEIGRNRRLVGEQEDDPPANMTPALKPRSHFGFRAKLGLAALIVGTIGHPAANVYPRLNLDVRAPEAERVNQIRNSNSGMAASAFPMGDRGRAHQEIGDSPASGRGLAENDRGDTGGGGIRRNMRK